MLMACAEHVHHSFLCLDIYILKTTPLQRLLLLRLAKPVSLMQSYAINPASLFVCLEQHWLFIQQYTIICLSVQRYIINMRKLLHRSSDYPITALLMSVFVFYHSLAAQGRSVPKVILDVVLQHWETRNMNILEFAYVDHRKAICVCSPSL